MSLYTTYISSLIDNLPPPPDTPKQLDLVLDGGGFKGSYLCGALFYLKELEKRNYVKINRISGSSIGAILGVLYCLDKLEIFDALYQNIRSDFKANMNLKTLHTYVDEFASKVTKEDLKNLNDKMYINFYDINSKKEEVVSKYTSVEHLLECIKYTSYLPIIIDGNIHYNNKVDGARPFIFQSRSKSDRKILYFDLSLIGKINTFFNTHHDQNGAGRILKGIIQIHDFFLYDNATHLCSYVNNWGIKDFIFYRIKELCWILCIYIINILTVVYKFMSPYIENSLIISRINNIIKKCIIDIFIGVVFT